MPPQNGISMKQDIKPRIQGYDPISLEEMNGTALMKRTDTKFLVPLSLLAPLLAALEREYRILEVNGKRVMRYSSLYFDTVDNRFYHDHHNGKNNRTKIRIRKYVDSGRCFLEVKRKNAKGVTDKSRTAIHDFEFDLSESAMDFITEMTSRTYDLTPRMWNDFSRITLVNTAEQERVTIDLGLSFSMDVFEKRFDDLVIVEVKQERFKRSSPIVQVLRSFKHHPYSISKYCVGMVVLYKGLKYNRFKRKLIRIKKIAN